MSPATIRTFELRQKTTAHKNSFPNSKHSVSVKWGNLSVLYKEITLIYNEKLAKHKNQFLILNLLVITYTWFKGLKWSSMKRSDKLQTSEIVLHYGKKMKLDSAVRILWEQ